MDEVSQERLDDAWDEGFAHGYSRGNEEGLKIAFKDGYDFGAKTVSAEFVAEIERLREQCDRMASLAIDNAKDTERAMRLREALAFYAEWGIDAPAVDAIIEEDRGDKARAALNIVLGEDD